MLFIVVIVVSMTQPRWYSVFNVENGSVMEEEILLEGRDWIKIIISSIFKYNYFK